MKNNVWKIFSAIIALVVSGVVNFILKQFLYNVVPPGRQGWAISGGVAGIAMAAAFVITYKLLTKENPFDLSGGAKKRRLKDDTGSYASHSQAQRKNTIPTNASEMGKPGSVKNGLTLLYITLGLSLLQSFLSAPMLLAQMPARQHDAIMFFSFLILCLLLFVVYMIGKGKNWARITYAALYIIGILFTIPSFPELLQSVNTGSILGVIGICQIIIQAIALYFLFQETSSSWFRQIKNDKKDTAQNRYSPEDYYPDRTHSSHKASSHAEGYGNANYSEAKYTVINDTSQNSIITCRQCGQKLRIPNDKTIDVTCPSCQCVFRSYADRRTHEAAGANSSGNWENLVKVALIAYAVPTTPALVYFNWQFANENGFVAWLFLGQIVPTLKALAWPFFINW